MRLELLKYGEALMYLNEYNLNTKPLEVKYRAIYSGDPIRNAFDIDHRRASRGRVYN